MQTENARCFVQSNEVELKTVGEDTFLVAPDAGGIHHLNRIGAAVWQQLETPTHETEIVALLTAAFPDVPEGQIAENVSELLDDLEDNMLVSVTAPA